MKILIALSALSVLAACANSDRYDPTAKYESVAPKTLVSEPNSQMTGALSDAAQHGKYLSELVGCGTCHTDGALTGLPRADRWFAGSRVGIAYTNPLEGDKPGVLFPGNLTPDKETGLSLWSDEEIARKIRTGIDRHGRASVPLMPWPAFSRFKDSDVAAIVAYLRSLPAVSHSVPAAVPAGSSTKEQYVHFGVYRNRR